LYDKFLRSDFVEQIPPEEMARSLDWVCGRLSSSPGVAHSITNVAFKIICSAIDFFDLPGVSERIADALLRMAKALLQNESISEKLHANRTARRRIASVAIRRAIDQQVPTQSLVTEEIASLAIRRGNDLWGAVMPRVGLIEKDDAGFLLAELEVSDSKEETGKLAHLIWLILYSVPWLELHGLDQVLQAARTNPVLRQYLKHIVGPVELHSEEAEQSKATYERELRLPSPTPERKVSLDDLLMRPVDENTLFSEICSRLAGESPCWKYPNRELPPGWEELSPEIRARVTCAADAYLRNRQPPAGFPSGNVTDEVMVGYWALRLLSVRDRTVFESLPDTVWDNWMSSVFGNPYGSDIAVEAEARALNFAHQRVPRRSLETLDHNSSAVTDEAEARLLNFAYQRAPRRFLETLDHFIEEQSHLSGEMFIVEKAALVWNSDVADLFRGKLLDDINSYAFSLILAALIKARDEPARRIATSLVESATHAQPDKLKQPVMAALVLLNDNPADVWKLVWRVVEANTEFAEKLFVELARSFYSRTTGGHTQGGSRDRLGGLVYMACPTSQTER
jgi:hypothetical protein